MFESAGQEGGRVVRGEGVGAEGDEVGVVGGREGVDGFGGGEGLCWQSASVLPPCAAWRMRMRWARAATQALFQNEQAGAFSGWLLGDDVRPVSYGTAKAMQPVEGDLLEFSFAEYGRCKREKIARHRSFDHLRTSNDFVVIEWRFH